MRLAWLSDVHFNFLTRDRLVTFISSLAKLECDAFLFTGDIAEANTLTAHLTVLDRSLDRPVYFVLGNHDFYRGSFSAIRRQVNDLVAQSKNLVYLTSIDTILLCPSVALVGHDSWADGRFGDFHRSRVVMNDFEFIGDFRGGPAGEEMYPVVTRLDPLAVMQKMADEAVNHFRQTIPGALAASDHVIVATHVPPFQDSAFHGGRAPIDDFLPFFACRIVGDYLREIMMEHPDKHMTVYCGHSHERHTVNILDNLKVETAGAEYGEPNIQEIITVD